MPGHTSANAKWERSCPGAVLSDSLANNLVLRSAGVWVAVVEEPIERFEWALAQLVADGKAPKCAAPRRSLRTACCHPCARPPHHPPHA